MRSLEVVRLNLNRFLFVARSEIGKLVLKTSKLSVCVPVVDGVP